MEETNTNIMKNCIITQSSQFIDNTSYNPFSSNQAPNSIRNQNNISDYQPIIRPYLNEIHNEEPKNLADNSIIIPFHRQKKIIIITMN
jgi:hypothetical protein